MIPLFMHQSDGWDGWYMWKLEFTKHFQIYSSISLEWSFSIYTFITELLYKIEQ